MKEHDIEHLEFLICRLVELYGEKPNVDYILRGREILAQEKAEKSIRDKSRGIAEEMGKNVSGFVYDKKIEFELSKQRTCIVDRMTTCILDDGYSNHFEKKMESFQKQLDRIDVILFKIVESDGKSNK